MKKRICMVIAGLLVMVLTAGMVSAEDEGAALESLDTMTIAVGTTGYTINIPEDCSRRDVDEEQKADDMVSSFFSEAAEMDIDIYQFDSEGQSIDEFVAEESVQYGSQDVILTNINNVDLAFYQSMEQRDDLAHEVFNYLFLDGDCFVEIVIWIDINTKGMSPQEHLAMLIINSLDPNGVVVSSAGVKTDDPVGIDLVLENKGEKQVLMDVSGFSLAYGDERLYSEETSVLVDAGQKDVKCTLPVGADKVETGTQISLYYGNILLATAAAQ